MRIRLNRNDGKSVAHPDGGVNALANRRLAPARRAADLAAMLELVEALERAGAPTLVVVAIAEGAAPNALALLDGAHNARRFLARFLTEGTPTLWHAGALVGLCLFGVRPEDAAGLAALERGRWYLPAPDGSEGVIDPTTRRHTRNANP